MISLRKLSEPRRLLLLRRHRGLLQKVAERCRVHPSLVSRVFHGQARSARVEREIQKALSQVRGEIPADLEPSKPPARPARPIDRSRELRWLADHRQQYSGQWVALAGDRLIASGLNPKDVFRAARRSGVNRPLVHRVEPNDTLPFGGW
jgi:transcriptional regulator with XRE-family HTH domain